MARNEAHSNCHRRRQEAAPVGCQHSPAPMAPTCRQLPSRGQRGGQSGRSAWSKLWSLDVGVGRTMVCGGPLSSGMVGAEHHPILTLRALSKIDNRAERAALLSDIEMDHSLQPVTRTCRLWVEAVGSNAQWFQGVSVELLLHCIYGVEANTINGKSWPTAVVPRCKRCHNTWRESHGTIVPIAEHV